MSSPDNGSDEQATASQNAPTRNLMSRLLQEVDLNKLSPKNKAVRILIGDQIPEGYKLNEIAAELGQPASWVSERLAELRAELLATGGIFPFPLSDNEYQALRDDIEENGIQVPIIIGENGLLDGRHRCLIWRDLGRENEPIPAVFVTGKTADEEHDIAWSVNSARRHLTSAQRGLLVEGELSSNPERSDRWIARLCGVSHTHVGATRARRIAAQTEENQLLRTPISEAELKLATHPTRISQDGRPRPATQPHRDQPRPDRFIATLECPHCTQEVVLMIGPNGHFLQSHERRN